MHSLKKINSALVFLNWRHNYFGILKDVVMLEKIMLCFYELKSLLYQNSEKSSCKEFWSYFSEKMSKPQNPRKRQTVIHLRAVIHRSPACWVESSLFWFMVETVRDINVTSISSIDGSLLLLVCPLCSGTSGLWGRSDGTPIMIFLTLWRFSRISWTDRACSTDRRRWIWNAFSSVIYWFNNERV